MSDSEPIEQKDVTEIGYSQTERSRLKLRLRLGRKLNALIQPVRDLAFLEHRYAVRRARSPGARLTDDEIRTYSAYMLDVQDADQRLQAYRKLDLSQSFQGLLIALFHHLAQIAPECRSVTNIGVNFAFIDYHLAQQYPHMFFNGVDFAPNIKEFNSAFKADNLTFISGYALDLISQGRLDADIFVMSSVAYEIKTAELKHYFDLFKTHGRYGLSTSRSIHCPAGL